MFEIPQNINKILERFDQNGYKAYIVGGCVRDMLLGKMPHDFDITTSAKPQEIINLFDKTIPTGIKHGTVTVLINDEAIEVTTFRTDGEYTDNRRPDNVIFVGDLKEDLKRRDFTVNALAYNKKEGLKDYFGGQNDLKNKILRAVGNPEARYREDALRILRLFRFAATLNFTIEEQTLNDALKCADLLKNVSRERIFEEIKKAVVGENFEILQSLIECGGLEFLNINHLPDFQKMKIHRQNPLLCLYILLKTEGLNQLKPSNKEKEYFKTLDLLSKMPINTDCDIKEMLNISEYNILKDYFTLNNLQTEKLERIINSREPYSIKHLAISGNDLMEKGYKGEEIGEILENLRKTVIANPNKNTKDYLLKKIP